MAMVPRMMEARKVSRRIKGKLDSVEDMVTNCYE